MPVISVRKDSLLKALGWEDNENALEKLEELCFQFGLEVEEVYKEKTLIEGKEGKFEEIEMEFLKIEIPANRYDLLSLEGIRRTLRIFLGLESIRKVRHSERPPEMKMTVKEEVLGVRRYVVCATLRGLQWDYEGYKSCIDMQDKLHFTLCRRRKLASIGTHDLDTIKPPFVYTAKRPEDIKFAPLGVSKELDGRELMEHYEGESHIRPYLYLIRESELYPVIYDSNGVVLSLPPIINGDHSKLSIKTKNMFIECTALDLSRARMAVQTLIAIYAESCKESFTIEPVEVIYPDGTVDLTPSVDMRICKTPIAYTNSLLGVNFTPEEIIHHLGRMGLEGEVEGENINVEVPISRSDILHAVDVIEDVGISYGYNKFKLLTPPSVTIGERLPISKYVDPLRSEIAMSGFVEMLTFSLVSSEDNNLRSDLPAPASVVNPKAKEFHAVRTSLLSGLLKNAAHNSKSPLPIKLFELNDVVHIDEKSDVGASNRKHVAILYSGKGAGFEVVHGMVDRIMMLLRIKLGGEKGYSLAKTPDSALDKVERSVHGAFLEGRCADVNLGGKKVGVIGVIHPKILAQYGIRFPCSFLEINLMDLVK